MKILVAYFSATGTTKKVAIRLAKLKQASLFEIIPKVLYTKQDLNWQDINSRSSKEMKDKNSRPEIANKIENIEDYNIIYLGFPIWWYQAPTIINTFLEMYNLKGKTIIPFATSGSSLMGKTNDYLIKSCKNAKLLEGKRFSENPSDEELINF